jgi:8-oxo-dGTP diphosphatase
MAVSEPVVEAAGGAMVRAGDDGPELLVVHRPAYDDWSIPKGKLERGETHEAAALREVLEETGWEGRLGDPLPDVRYRDRKGRPKRVRYWKMTPVHTSGFTPNDEIDEIRWCSFREAATLLTHDADRRMIGLLGDDT